MEVIDTKKPFLSKEDQRIKAPEELGKAHRVSFSFLSFSFPHFDICFLVCLFVWFAQKALKAISKTISSERHSQEMAIFAQVSQSKSRDSRHIASESDEEEATGDDELTRHSTFEKGKWKEGKKKEQEKDKDRAKVNFSSLFFFGLFILFFHCHSFRLLLCLSKPELLDLAQSLAL